mmetsp:Transcript_9311/g.18353  ORF Transcript_9311/g.18353 Transcript_9311/m.18353 type:complete len:201 (+) Transcript_9311:170-772(+)
MTSFGWLTRRFARVCCISSLMTEPLEPMMLPAQISGTRNLSGTGGSWSLGCGAGACPGSGSRVSASMAEISRCASDTWATDPQMVVMRSPVSGSTSPTEESRMNLAPEFSSKDLIPAPPFPITRPAVIFRDKGAVRERKIKTTTSSKKKTNGRTRLHTCCFKQASHFLTFLLCNSRKLNSKRQKIKDKRRHKMTVINDCH